MPQMKINYRPMGIKDVEAVHHIEMNIFPTPWSLKSYRFEVERNQASLPWVAELEERIIAYIVPWILVDEIHIANLAVHPNFRNKGIASKLLVGALLRARKAGVISSTLEVRSGNDAAQGLYRSLGYEKVGTRKAYYKDNGEDAMIMQLENLEDLFLQNLMEAS